MDDEVVKLQQSLQDVERVAEDLFLAKSKGVEYDRVRNSNREALTALRKLANTSTSSLLSASSPILDGGQVPRQVSKPDSCRVCGSYDGGAPTWILGPSTDCFIRIPFHDAHSFLESEQEQVEADIASTRAEVKEKTLLLSDKGGLPDSAGPGLVNALINLKDNS
eukprot:TRINITY_DN5242_c0_g3_i1.p2 TRINITY_DN5242_c0_g3~~TRINITY_DN5242_c0_g3_i1.p2  ORF type:complete len:165 (+),score=34.85 TRINITY_DN5242_c0_g3_i1:53-547(+)